MISLAFLSYNADFGEALRRRSSVTNERGTLARMVSKFGTEGERKENQRGLVIHSIWTVRSREVTLSRSADTADERVRSFFPKSMRIALSSPPLVKLSVKRERLSQCALPRISP